MDPLDAVGPAMSGGMGKAATQEREHRSVLTFKCESCGVLYLQAVQLCKLCGRFTVPREMFQ